MKKLLQGPVSLPRYFKTFVAVMALLSIFGGYQLTQLMYRMNDFYLQRTEKLLAMQGSLDDAAITLGRQVQEWKNMLLRVNETELYSRHRQAFFDCSKGVQEALLRTKTAMQDNGMETSEIEQLLTEHQLLLSDYLLARIMLNPGRVDSYHEVDNQIIGIDRKLQHHIAVTRTDIEKFSRQQLNGTLHAQRNHYLLIGLLGALSLLIMSLAGVAFAGLFQGNKTGTAGLDPHLI
jgi:methyl-accepting chemotaxis protein